MGAALRHVGFVCALLGLLVVQLAAVGHQLLIRHSMCEHGAVVHADHEQHDAAPSVVHTSSEPAVEPGARAEGSHEHCDPAGVRSSAVKIGAPLVPPTLLDGYLLPWSVRPQHARAPLAILSFAPKNSPPV